MLPSCMYALMFGSDIAAWVPSGIALNRACRFSTPVEICRRGKKRPILAPVSDHSLMAAISGVLITYVVKERSEREYGIAQCTRSIS